MNFTNMLYLLLWVFVYYGIALLFMPYAINLLSNISIFSGTWASAVPADTEMIINIFIYIIIPFVAIAYSIRASSPEQQIVVSQ